MLHLFPLLFAALSAARHVSLPLSFHSLPPFPHYQTNTSHRWLRVRRHAGMPLLALSLAVFLRVSVWRGVSASFQPSFANVLGTMLCLSAFIMHAVCAVRPGRALNTAIGGCCSLTTVCCTAGGHQRQQESDVLHNLLGSYGGDD